MNNRFGPDVSSNARTDSVIMLDDDNMISREMFRRLIDAFYSYTPASRRPVVGILNDARMAVSSGSYLYPCNKIEGWIPSHLYCYKTFASIKSLNMVIGKAMLFDRKYLEQYQNHEQIQAYTEKYYCEDIFMNALILNSNEGVNPLLVMKDGEAQRFVLDEIDGMSNYFKGIKWRIQRELCIKWAAELFGGDVWRQKY